MFFWLSKILWYLVQPLNLLFLVLCAALLLSLLGHSGWARGLLALVIASLLVVALLPVNALLVMPLEQRFARPEPLPERIDGVILLGGAQQPRITAEHGVPALNDAGERMVAFAALARRYPEARLVFTGGSGDPLNQDLSEAETVRLLLGELGIDAGRVAFEDRARNTWENALFARDLAAPLPEQRWLLVTSAMHMPRAVGVFRKLGWSVLAYPCDYRGPAELAFQPQPDLLGALVLLSGALREWIGLVAYRLAGKTEDLLPAP